MANIPKIDEYYKKNDTTYLIIRSYKPDKYDIENFQAKRKYHIYIGNDIWGYRFYGRYYKLSDARQAVLDY